MVETISSDNPQGAAIADIEKELVNLWRQVGSGEKPMMRARVFTLVAVAAEAEETERIEQLAQLSGRHPARNLLLLLGDVDAEDYLDADVTLLCNVRPHGLCAEQIRLHARGAALEHLSATVRGLLTANLSVVLWWTLPFDPANPLFKQLAELSDRIVVDTQLLDDVQNLAFVQPEMEGIRVNDLTWDRLTHWREAIAQCFDAAHQRDYLAEITQVRIKTGASVTPGWLLAGWLASRLDWLFLRGDIAKLRFKNPEGRTIAVEIVAGKGEDAIVSVSLSGEEVRFEVERINPTCLQNRSELPDTPVIEQVTRLPDESEPASLSRELDRTAPDATFVEALTAVHAMLEKIE